jgi:hypothetical protein
MYSTRYTRCTFDQYSKLPDDYKEIRRCILCSNDYIELKNIGQFQCSIHPGVILKSKDHIDFYSCCGTIVEKKYYKGCTKCDHTDINFTDDLIIQRLIEIKSFSTITITKLLFKCNIIPPLFENVIYDSDRYNNNSPLIKYQMKKLKSKKDHHDQYFQNEKLSYFITNEEELDADNNNIKFEIDFKLNEIKKQMYEQSLNSPLILSFDSFDDVFEKKKLISQSNSNWAFEDDDIEGTGTGGEQDPDIINHNLNKKLLNKKVIDIPYIIIKRVDV